MDIADLIGLHIAMSKFAGKGQLKFMIAGMGWATAELVVTRFVLPISLSRPLFSVSSISISSRLCNVSTTVSVYYNMK